MVKNTIKKTAIIIILICDVEKIMRVHTINFGFNHKDVLDGIGFIVIIKLKNPLPVESHSASFFKIRILL